MYSDMTGGTYFTGNGDKPSRTRDELEILKGRVERLEMIILELARAIDFHEDYEHIGVMKETKRLLGKY
jgi:hypothetical protein